jgi:NADH-quinone oxidoreductase subunit N
MSRILQFPPAIVGFLGSMILVILTVSLFLPPALHKPFQSNRWIYRLTLLTLMASLIWIITIYPINKNVLLGGHFIWDPLTALLSMTVIGFSIPVFIYAEDDLHYRSIIISDYYILGLLSLFGALVMLTGGSLFSFYLGLEIMSLPLYGMVALDAKEVLRTEAAMKYIIMGMLAGILLLYGFCLLYFADRNFSLNILPILAASAPTLLTQIGEGLLLSAVLFKLGAMPFHFWVPDVYQGASTATSLFIATIPKCAAIGMGLRLFLNRLGHLTTDSQSLLLGLGLLSIISGNLIALMQTHIRRLLAYSSIAHMGFILLGFALPATGYSMALFYGINYCFMTTILFGTLAHLTRVGLEVNTIQDLKGLSAQYPMAALLILLVMSSMAGIPPFIGFFSKFGLLYSLLKQEFYVVASIALLATVIGAYYYLNIIKRMYFELPLGQTTITAPRHRMSQVILGCSGLMLISLSLSPGTLLNTLEKSITASVTSVEKTHLSSPSNPHGE